MVVEFSDCNFHSYAFIPVFHVPCFKLDYFYVFSASWIRKKLISYSAALCKCDFFICLEAFFEFIFPFPFIAAEYYTFPIFRHNWTSNLCCYGSIGVKHFRAIRFTCRTNSTCHTYPTYYTYSTLLTCHAKDTLIGHTNENGTRK